MRYRGGSFAGPPPRTARDLGAAPKGRRETARLSGALALPWSCNSGGRCVQWGARRDKDESGRLNKRDVANSCGSLTSLLWRHVFSVPNAIRHGDLRPLWIPSVYLEEVA